ncbi:MAG: OmpA family protein, partial [Proteobacteria bacterium]|nr:OmpA family protein [Pseudomonadota bacterium]
APVDFLVMMLPLFGLMVIRRWREREGSSRKRSGKTALRFLGAILILASFLIGTAAQAQIVLPVTETQPVNAQLFVPVGDSGNFLVTYDSRTLKQLGIAGGLFFNYARNPVVVSVDESTKWDLLRKLRTLDLALAFGLTDWLQISAAFPYNFYANTNDLGHTDFISSSYPGDFRAEVKFRLMDRKKKGIGLALLPFITAPSGEESRFVGEKNLTFGGLAIADFDLKVFRLGMNLGFKQRNPAPTPDQELGNEVLYHLAANFPVVKRVELIGDLYGSTVADALFEKRAGNPLELDVALRILLDYGVALTAGGGHGFTQGIGSPEYRMFAGVTYRTPETEKPLVSRPKVEAPVEKKVVVVPPPAPAPPKVADRDNDGIRDDVDKCPDEPETLNGYQDNDGCPDIVPKATIRAMVLNEATDKPFIGTVKVRVKETGQEFTFNLADGIFNLDLKDAGTYKLEIALVGGETKNLQVTTLPGQIYPLILKTSKPPDIIRIEKHKLILPPIFFETGKAVIMEKSYPVLDSVAIFMKDRSNMKISIEGHTDSTFEENYNLKLSQDRAASVRQYLIDHGIDASRSASIGYGQARPIATNDTEEGRSQNRRVEFIVLEGGE